MKISEDLVLRGIRDGIIKFIPDPNGDGEYEPVAQIGDYWFYFAGIEGEDKTVDEYLASVSEEDLAREVSEAIGGLWDAERDYYISFLLENISERTYLVPVTMKVFGFVPVTGRFIDGADAAKWAAGHQEDLPCPKETNPLPETLRVDVNGLVMLT